MARSVVIFDLDGTLIDSAEAVVETAVVSYEAHDLPAPDREAIRQGIGTALPDMLARGGVPAGLNAAVTQTYRELYRPIAERLESPFAGILSLLQDLHSQGLRLAIATGKSQFGADRGAVDHGLLPYMDAVVGMDGSRRGKPHPDILLTALAEVGAAPTDAIMVGDTTFDLDMARSIGVPAIAVTWGVHSFDKLQASRPDAVAHSVDELAASIEAALA
jgi:phosphoglycolate phosphatase